MAEIDTTIKVDVHDFKYCGEGCVHHYPRYCSLFGKSLRKDWSKKDRRCNDCVAKTISEMPFR